MQSSVNAVSSSFISLDSRVCFLVGCVCVFFWGWWWWQLLFICGIFCFCLLVLFGVFVCLFFPCPDALQSVK